MERKGKTNPGGITVTQSLQQGIQIMHLHDIHRTSHLQESIDQDHSTVNICISI